MPVLAVVPARLGSTRIPQKPLQLLAGVPLVVRVVARVHGLGVADRVVVATDAESVAHAVSTAGYEALLTGTGHSSGTERTAEVIENPRFSGFDLILNVQGDEPFVSEEACVGALERVRGGDDVGTAASPLAAERVGDPAVVKVVMDGRGRALYFSRAAVPYPADDGLEAWWQHQGVYAYRPSTLRRWAGLPPTDLERRERLEQLRALEHGLSIGVARLEREAPSGIDTPEDLQRAQAIWDLIHEERQ